MKNKNGVELLEKINVNHTRDVMYKCKCPNCNNIFYMWSSHYYRGSNGCKCKNYKKKYPRLYSIWTNIKTRCNNSKSPSYKNYGARGITVCDEWSNDFKAFYDWAMSHNYTDALTIDRIDNYKGYSPDNCRWATAIAQGNNKRNNIIVDGMSLRRFCIIHNLNYKSEYSYFVRNGYDALVNRLAEWYEGKLIELENEVSK